MTTFRVLGLAACVLGLLVAGACGEDEGLVRPRMDAGADGAPPDASDTLACGVVRPTEYSSQSFETNAAAELQLADLYDQLDAKLRAPDGPDAGSVTAADLKAFYSTGSPSLRGLSTPGTSNVVDGAFDAFEAALPNSWAPTDPEQDGGGATGGLYGTFYVSATGVDLRETVTKALLQGVFYNDVLSITASPVNDVAVDRLVAAFGATRAFASRTDADAGLLRDRLIAEYASNRDDKQAATGPYRSMRDALLTMKGAISGGEKCNAERDAAVAAFRLEWEKTVFASAIYYLNQAATIITADPSKGPEAIHAYGTALAFIASFANIPADKRHIQDAQLAALLDKIGAATPWKLVTAVGERVPNLTAAISDIKLYEGLTDVEVESFKKTF